MVLTNDDEGSTHKHMCMYESTYHEHTHTRIHIHTNIHTTHMYTRTYIALMLYAAHTEVWSTNTQIIYKLFVTLSNLGVTGLFVTNKKLLTQSSYA